MFVVYYTVRFADARVLDVFDEMMSSSIFAANCKVFYARYICFAKMMGKDKGDLALEVSVAMERSVAKRMGTTHLDEPDPCFHNEEDVLLKKKSLHHILKNDNKPAFLRASAFYSHASALFDECHIRDMEQGEKRSQNLSCFFRRGFSWLGRSPIQSCRVYYYEASFE